MTSNRRSDDGSGTADLDDSDSEALRLAERIAQKMRESQALRAIRDPGTASHTKVATPTPG
jgi:hypothetical protein